MKRIYIIDLKAYSEGHEEVFITDYEAEIIIGEYDNIERLNELADAMEEFSDDGLFGAILKSLEFYIDYEKIARDYG